jgi:hypothetical protein
MHHSIQRRAAATTGFVKGFVRGHQAPATTNNRETVSSTPEMPMPPRLALCAPWAGWCSVLRAVRRSAPRSPSTCPTGPLRLDKPSIYIGTRITTKGNSQYACDDAVRSTDIAS